MVAKALGEVLNVLCLLRHCLWKLKQVHVECYGNGCPPSFCAESRMATPGTNVTDLLKNGVLGRCLIPTATSICLRPLSPWAIPLLRNPGALSARGKADTECPQSSLRGG